MRRGYRPMTADLERLREWIGRTEEATDLVSAAPLRGLAALLDRAGPEPAAGAEVPPGGHWLYFLPAAPQAEIGPDGHPLRGGFLPPVALPRRMWAGSRLEFLAPLRVGETVRRVSTIRDVTLKEGKSGTLVFVAVRHQISGPAGPALIEDQDIVYRDAPAADAAAPRPKPAPADAAWRRMVRPDSVMLFRYSALTFNGHRIHYDRAYATEVEGYPGLVVHGPLIATLLLDLVGAEMPEARLAAFDVRMVGPLFDTADFTVAGMTPGERSAELWAADASGALAARATARLEG